MNIIILILGLLAAFGPLSIDMYLPALPKIAQDFGTDLSSVQLSLASYFIGIALGQVFYGPFTDLFGRKKPLYFGLVLYTLASFLCATTNSVDGLVAFRFLQAIGACAGMVISRAVVRDLYEPRESARIFSMLMLIMGVAPILAPVLGGVLADTLGWRSIFWILTGVSIFTLVAIHFFLRETYSPDQNFKLKNTFRNYLEVLKDRNFTGFTFSLAFIFAGLFAYITGSSFVFIQHYGLTPVQYSWVFGTNAFGFILFSQINTRLLHRYTPENIIKMVLPVTASAGFLILLVGIFNGPLVTMCLSLFLFMLTLGLIAPNASASALANQKKLAGSASAMMGTIQFSVSAICSGLVSHFHDGTLIPMTGCIFFCSIMSFSLYWFMVHRPSNAGSVSRA